MSGQRRVRGDVAFKVWGFGAQILPTLVLPSKPTLSRISFQAALRVGEDSAGQQFPPHLPAGILRRAMLHLKGTQTTNCLETRLPVNN